MKSFRFLALLALSGLFSCAPKSVVNLKVEGLGEGCEIVVSSSYAMLDTLKTDASGHVRFKADIQASDPEFVHFYYQNGNVASVILLSGDKIDVVADTLGNYSVSGSVESELLLSVKKSSSDFLSEIYSEEDSRKLGEAYVAHYREGLKFILEHPRSLACIPVLFEKMGPYNQVFGKNSDAVYFRRVADSLKVLYPDSKYVKSLEKEADSRFNAMQMKEKFKNAAVMDYPQIELPDMNGKKVALKDVDAKLVLVHFWDAADVSQKIMNIETLMPLYEEYKGKGFEIYSVCLTPDKVLWGNVVHAQKLPWINVNDGKGTASRAAAMYNVKTLPCSYLIGSDGVKDPGLSGKGNLRKSISALLD